MLQGVAWGLALVWLGGLLNGSFAVPMKGMPAWRWENIWLVYSVCGMIAGPWLLAVWTVPGLAQVLHQADAGLIALVMIFGFGWGLGSTLFGLGISRVGMALGFAIILGITASLGSLLPLVVMHPKQLLTRQGYTLMAGLAVVLFGVLLCAVAGQRRERETSSVAQDKPQRGYTWGLVICVLAGILSPMLNFSFVFGGRLQQSAASRGASVASAANPIWALALTAGFVANAGYCVWLLSRNHTWPVFRLAGPRPYYWAGAALMGALWFAGIATYGAGAAVLGSLGAVFGWPLFMSTNIIAANLLGAATGEWRGVSRWSYALSWTGIGVLLAAILVIATASRG